MELSFADCVLCPASRQLFRGGAAVPLEPKMFTLLEALIERRPAVVTYAELDELLWPQVYVARTSLTRLVSELRTLLGDAPSDSRIIRTVYKTGYAFAATATAMATATPLGRPAPAAAFSLLFDGRVLPLVDGENVAGRGAECAPIVDATTVSRRHARFSVVAGVATVEDLGSTNGTFVNGAPITSATPVRDGDEIALGKALLRLRLVEPSAPTEMITREAAARRATRR
jgi:DNA-binding winged helix-turn-helix (wHTH) protein